MVTRKEIYMKPRKNKKAFARTAYHYIILFAVFGIVTYAGYEFLAKDVLDIKKIYDDFFYVYNIALFMILNFIFLYSVVKRGVSKTLGLIGISALTFIIFNLASPYVARFIFKGLETDIVSFFTNTGNISKALNIRDAMFFNYIPIILSLAMWALLTLIIQPFSRPNTSKKNKKADLEVQREI